MGDYLVEVLEHHGELTKSLFRNTRLVSGLDLLFQVVLHAHCQLVELIPRLSQSDSRTPMIFIRDRSRNSKNKAITLKFFMRDSYFWYKSAAMFLVFIVKFNTMRIN